jgi:hypothetical protein
VKRDAGPHRNDGGHIFLVHGFLQELAFFAFLVFLGPKYLASNFRNLLRSRQLAVTDLGDALQIAFALGHFGFAAQIFDLLAQRAASRTFFSVLPFPGKLVVPAASAAEVLSQFP